MRWQTVITASALALSFAIATQGAIAASPTKPAAAPKAVTTTVATPQLQPQIKVEVVTAALSPAECEVWNRERGFASSVEHHDAKAFVDFIDPNAAFNAGTRAPVHGRAAVAVDWKEIVEGKQIKLRWSPAIVTIGGDGSLAISRGPSWLEDLRPDAKQRYRIGEFISTWSKNRDGKWRVLFDSGATPMHAATADEVAQLVAAIPKNCQATPR
jgi:ketosteroid isomerase-like protein